MNHLVFNCHQLSSEYIDIFITASYKQFLYLQLSNNLNIINITMN